MRLLWLTVLWTAVYAAQQSESLQVKNILKSWNPEKPSDVLEHLAVNRNFIEDITSDSHKRSKRDVSFSSNNIDSSCRAPGYTGPTCRPVCSQQNPSPDDNPDVDGEGATIDSAIIANCSTHYVVYVDETMTNVRIEMETDAAINPLFSLIDSNGDVKVPLDIMERSDRFEGYFGLLAPGRYNLLPMADVQTHYCQLTIRANTHLNVGGGFVNDEGNQPERSDFPSKGYVYKDQVAVGVFHANYKGHSLHVPASLDTIAFNGGNNNAYREFPLGIRYNCSHEYVYESFVCRNLGDFLYYIQGTTAQGYTFRRVYPVTCLSAPSTQAPPITTTAPVTACNNSGTLITNLDGSTYCYCNDRWAGSDCSNIVCFNGGTVRNNVCFCPSEFTGNHCEHMICDNEQGFDFDAEHPTLILAIRVRHQTQDVAEAIVNATRMIVNQLQFDTGYLTHFIAVFFNNNEILFTQEYSNSDLLIGDLIFYSSSEDNEGGCSDIVFQAASAALDRQPTNKSPVYVITDAIPNDTDYAEQVFFQAALWRSPIHFILVKPDPTCPIATDSYAFRKMGEVGAKTNGELFYVTDRGSFQNLFYTHMAKTLYKSQLMYQFDYPVCAAQLKYQTVAVDNFVDQLTVIGLGKSLSLSVTAPEGYDMSNLITTAYSDGTNFIWTLNGLHAGNFFLMVSSSDGEQPCSLKVYQKAYEHLPSVPQYDIFYSFSEAISIDGFLLEPLVGVTQSVSFHVKNFVGQPEEMSRSFLEVYAVRNEQQQQVYASNGFFRDGCPHNFYFPDFHCQVPNEIMQFNLYVGTNRGFSIQRAGTFTCTQIQPTSKPPGDCLNGGVINAANTTCYCPMGYKGTHCEQLDCFNGGTPSGNKCACPVGFVGTVCEFMSCTARGASPEFELGQVDMVFAVELTQNANGQVAYLSKHLSSLIKDIQNVNPLWISRFVLVGFNTTWGDVLAISPSWDPSGVIEKLNEVASVIPTDKGCNVQLYRALDNAVRKNDVRFGSHMELFMASNPDISRMSEWIEIYEDLRAMNLHITVYLGVSPRFATDINPTGLYCNATWDSLGPLEALTYSGIGSIYASQQATVPSLLKTIPLEYTNQMVYDFHAADCTNGYTVYFPVDSYTQTIQLDVIGQNPQVVIRDIYGVELPLAQIAYDEFSMTSVFEAHRPCDPGWTQFGTSCYFFGQELLSWPAAKTFCHNTGGQLSDDLNDDTHTFITTKLAGVYSFWMGGFNNGTWLWDRANGLQPVKIQSDYVYWQGGSPPDDETLQCMFWNGVNRGVGDTWTASTCAEPRFFLCEKHTYDASYYPDPNDDGDHLPAGKYYFEIKTSPSTIYPANPICSVNVRVQSTLQLVTGFVNNFVQDWPNNDPIVESTTNRMISFVQTKDNTMRTPILLNAWIKDAYNDTFYNSARYDYRLNCEWPWVSQTFACPPGSDDGSELAIMHTGEDEFGFSFQRYTLGHCSEPTLTCGNGGINYNGQCICDEYWQGSFCTVPICVNNGSLASNGKECNCPDGYAGFNCQFETCKQKNTSPFIQYAKSLIIVLENTFRNADAATNFANNLPQAVNAGPKNWFNSFIVVTYDSKTVQMDLLDDVDSARKFILSAVFNAADAGSCSMPTWNAINLFMNSDLWDYVQYPRSEMVVITSSGVKDASDVRSHDLHVLADAQITLHYIYSASDCGTTPGDNVNSIVRLAYTTEGTVAFVTNAGIGQYFAGFLSTRYGSSTLSYPTYGTFTCRNTDSWLVSVDFKTTYIYVAVTAQIGSVGARNPNGDSITPDLVSSDGMSRLYRINTMQYGSPGGIWKISLSSPTACYVAIYAQGGASVYPLYAQATSDNSVLSRQDGTKHSPYAGQLNVLTAHLATGDIPQNGRLTYAKIYDSDKGVEILSSALYLRLNCGYEYVSDPFTCDSDLLTVFIHGYDATNQAFRRQYTSYCIGNNKTTTVSPPVTTQSTPNTPQSVITTTQKVLTTTSMKTTVSPMPAISTSAIPNTPLVFDIVIIVDESLSSADTHDTLHSFIQTLLVPYTLDQQHTRVALIGITGIPGLQVPAAFLNSISKREQLHSYIDDLQQYADYNDPGQYLQEGLDITTADSFKSSGYRSDISNHVILYLTSTADFSDNPQKPDSSYGMITVGYGVGLDINNLTPLTGGKACTFVTQDTHELNTNILQSVRTLISNANSNGGKYC